MKKRPILAAAAVIAVGAAWALLAGHGGHADPVAGAAPPQVSVAPALLREVGDTDEFTGRLQAVDTVQVRPRVDGYVESVHFQEGTLVKQGQLLYQIDPRPYQAEVDRLAANLAQARAELALAQSNAARASRLLAQHAVSREEADRQLTAEQSARAQTAATAAALAAARLNLGFTQVRAPIDGRVSNAQVTRGNLVTGSDVLTSVVSVDPIYAYFDVDEQAYLRLLRARPAAAADDASGVRATMALADEDGFPHSGRIDFVDNQLRAGSGTIRLRAVFANPAGAYTPGLYVRMRLESGKARPRVLVDDRAIGTDLGNKFVFVIGKDHKVDYRRVETGPLFGGLRVVDTGLKSDELVVVNGMQRVRPGVEVRPVPVSMTANLSEAERAHLGAIAPPAATPTALASAKTPQ